MKKQEVAIEVDRRVQGVEIAVHCSHCYETPCRQRIERRTEGAEKRCAWRAEGWCTMVNHSAEQSQKTRVCCLPRRSKAEEIVDEDLRYLERRCLAMVIASVISGQRYLCL